jgi:hypothetical protein
MRLLGLTSQPLPEIAAWHKRMAELQRAPFTDRIAWPEAHLVFRQSEHD